MRSFLDRIIVNINIMNGKPVIKGTRIPIYVILHMLRDGASFEKILHEYPELTEKDIRAVLDYSIYLITQENEDIIPLAQDS